MNFSSFLLASFVVAVVVSASLIDARPPKGLYGLSNHTALVRIDATTGNTVSIGNPIPYEAIAQQLATIDPINAIYYFIGLNLTDSKTNLVGLSMADGTIVSEVSIPIISGFLVGVGEVMDFDAETQEVICVGRESTLYTAPHHMLRVNPKTGAVTDLGTFVYVDVLGGGSGFDAGNFIEWVGIAVNNSGVFHMNLLGVNVHDGSTAFNVSNSLNVNTFAYDHKTGKMLCMGTDSQFQRILVSLNSKDGSLKQLAVIQDYLIIDGSLNALNSEDRILYVILEKTKGTGELFLVGINADTGAIVSSAPLCDLPTGCPWSFEFLP